MVWTARKFNGWTIALCKLSEIATENTIADYIMPYHPGDSRPLPPILAQKRAENFNEMLAAAEQRAYIKALDDVDASFESCDPRNYPFVREMVNICTSELRDAQLRAVPALRKETNELPTN